MDPNFKRVIKRKTIQSQALQTEKEILISFPPGITETDSVPVLLLHDGDDYFQMGRIVTQVNPLIDQGELTPFLVVGTTVDKQKRNQEYSPLGQNHLHHLRFVVDELLPFLQSTFRAEISTDQLVVGGSSLGATVSLHLALQYPQKVKRILSQSGAFLDETFRQVKQASSLASFRIYQSIGQAETAVPTHAGVLDLVAHNRQMHQLFVDKEADVSYHEADGEHTWRLWQQDLIPAIRYFFG